MKASVRHNLVNTAVISSDIIVEMSASANADQREILGAVLPSSENGPVTKMASLARLLAAADMVEEPAAA